MFMLGLREQIIARIGRINLRPDTDSKDQHFLICEEVVERIVDAAGVTEHDCVLEIGPGPGQVSESILKRGAQLIAIEIDEAFKPLLEEIARNHEGKFEVIWGSALKVAWPSQINKIVMSPPYSILEPLLEILHAQSGIECVSMAIGQSYYERAIVRSGRHGFTKSSLLTQAKFEPSLVMKIGKDCFYPAAGERSVVMLLTAVKKSNPVLKKLADYFVGNPLLSVGFVTEQVLEVINKRARKYRDFRSIVSVRNLGFNPNLRNKRLQDLTNYEIEFLVSKLTAQYNFQRKGGHPGV
jgi:16S rRNA A1518/A1519 N6-dimethyltransferase RsmA/KsgA/DIM1 with predicted DNA glycosylase/AP lyase activity